jgi:trans-aconitate methyltransferase
MQRNSQNCKPILEFGKVADKYSKYRLPYPEELFKIIFSTINSFDLAIDIGAGTGLSTAPILSKFNKILAVEPDENMAEKLKEHLNSSKVDVIIQSGEDFTFSEDNANLITCGFVFHWLKGDAFISKAFKGLRHHCPLAIYSGSYYSSLPEELKTVFAPDYELNWKNFQHKNMKVNDIEKTLNQLKTYGSFSKIELHTIDNIKQLQLTELVGLLSTISYVSSYLMTLENPQLYLQNLENRIYNQTKQTQFTINFEINLILAIK